jgi:hypothetical protein
LDKETSLDLVTYCGLYCGLCAQRGRIPKQASQLQQSLHNEGFDDFYQYVPEMKDKFPVFWRFLGNLSTFDCRCRNGSGGPPDCKIRECARRKGTAVCPKCDKYPCEHIESLAEHYPTLIQDGKRLQKVGLKEWIAEQERRVKRGFVYADVRYATSGSGSG